MYISKTTARYKSKVKVGIKEMSVCFLRIAHTHTQTHTHTHTHTTHTHTHIQLVGM